MELTKKRIGVFDSGIGGFSILQELVKVLPGHEFFYISDNPHAPYGNKSKAYIIDRCKQITSALIKEKVDIVVVACNTATAEGIDSLRQNFTLPFVGVEPFVKAIQNFDLIGGLRKPLILSTLATHNSQRFQNLLRTYDPDGQFKAYPCPNLASLIEEAFDNGFKTIEPRVNKELAELKGSGYTHAILGCTHYPLIKKQISHYLEVECISPCSAVAKRVADILDAQGLSCDTQLHFKTSDQENFNSLNPALLSLKP